MTSTKKETHWIPLADLMTVLMVMFLFMAISYMALVQKRQKEKDDIIKNYEESKIALFNDLKIAFAGDTIKGILKLDKDLSIKFTDPQVLFPTRKAEITPYFQKVLNEFLPKYLTVVLQKKYADKIAEIRIEGHTDTYPLGFTSDPYIDNMELSQGRARNVLAFLRSRDCFDTLSIDKKQILQFWITANGLSYGRTLDKNLKSTYESHLPINDEKSRRVEFKIVMNSDSTINKSLNKISSK